jgi:hypothetical protein
VEQDLEQGGPVQVVAADRAYDDTRNHYFSKVRGIESAICLKENRTEKKDPNKAGWVAMKQKPEYIEGSRERYTIERKFGEAEQGHGLGPCRYLGLLRYRIQVYMTVLALNLKRMVKLLTGVNFKGSAKLSAGCRGTSTADEGRTKDEGVEWPHHSPERCDIGAPKILHPP